MFATYNYTGLCADDQGLDDFGKSNKFWSLGVKDGLDTTWRGMTISASKHPHSYVIITILSKSHQTPKLNHYSYCRS